MGPGLRPGFLARIFGEAKKDGGVEEAKKDDGYNPLISASKFGHLKIVKYLIEKGANVNKRTKYGKTAYDYMKLSELEPNFVVVKD